MAITIKYIVRRPFKYAGVKLKPGDEWQPSGSRNDSILVNSRYVERVEINQDGAQDIELPKSARRRLIRR